MNELITEIKKFNKSLKTLKSKINNITEEQPMAKTININEIKPTSMYFKSTAFFLAFRILQAIPAKPAIPEIKDDKGKVTQKAKPATEERHANFAVKCASLDHAEELAARMNDQGFPPICDGDGNVEVLTGDDFPKSKKWLSDDIFIQFQYEEKSLRAALKKCKSKEHYNKAGADSLQKEKEAAAAKKREENKKKLEVEEETKAQKKADEKAKKTAKKTESTPKKKKVLKKK